MCSQHRGTAEKPCVCSASGLGFHGGRGGGHRQQMVSNIFVLLPKPEAAKHIQGQVLWGGPVQRKGAVQGFVHLQPLLKALQTNQREGVIVTVNRPETTNRKIYI